jgi:protein-tyrosine phosphatase
MEILPRFWISYYNDSYVYLLKEKKIRNILHISKKESFTKMEDLEEIRIPIDYNEHDSIDHMNNILYQQLFDITEYIHDKLLTNQKILLIGYDDKQDIDNLIIAYLIRYGKLTVKDAILFLRSKKNNIFVPKILFYDSLNKFYEQLNRNKK